MQISAFFVLFSAFLVNLCRGAAYSCHVWSKAEEDSICTLASQKAITFCSASGAADDECKTIASTAGGVSPQCSDAEVCSFTVNGEPAYVSCNSKKSGYEILRNCLNNVGIACPNPTQDLSDSQRLVNTTGKDGCGKYEQTTLADRLICNLDVEDTLYSCESQTLRDDLIRTFHPEKRLGGLSGGFCMDIRNSTDDTNYKEVVRCVFSATFFNDELGQRDACRIHLYNQKANKPKILAVAYWGSKNLLRLEDIVDIQ